MSGTNRRRANGTAAATGVYIYIGILDNLISHQSLTRII